MEVFLGVLPEVPIYYNSDITEILLYCVRVSLFDIPQITDGWSIYMNYTIFTQIPVHNVLQETENAVQKLRLKQNADAY